MVKPQEKAAQLAPIKDDLIKPPFPVVNAQLDQQ